MNDQFDQELSDAVGQRNMQWQMERLGRFTSSRYKDLLQTGRKKDERFGNTCMRYVYEKIGEILAQAPHTITSQAMEWGTDNEQNAADQYEIISGNKVKPVGFVKFGEFAGGSPDGEIIGGKGIIEIKCPFNPSNHVRTLVTNEVPEEYIAQMQGNMMCTDAEFCDFISYDPRILEKSLQLVIVRVDRDEAIIKTIKDRIEEVVILMKEIMETLK